MDDAGAMRVGQAVAELLHELEPAQRAAAAAGGR